MAKLPFLAMALDHTVTYLFALTNDPHQRKPYQGHDCFIVRDSALPRPSNDVTQVQPSCMLGAQVTERGYCLGTL